MLIKIKTVQALKDHPIRETVENYMKDEVPFKDIQDWIKKDGFDISIKILKKAKKELFKSVIEKVHEKSAILVEELSTERLNLSDSIEHSIKQLNTILDSADMNALIPQNAKELAQLLSAKANLTRAELDLRIEMPKKNLAMLNLIEKTQALKKKETALKT